MLVRHADAGDRSSYDRPDHLRPLSHKGELQAEKIAERLVGIAPSHIVSSHAIRCIATVEPLARRLALEIEELEALVEGSDPKSALSELLDRQSVHGGVLVACSHGDVIPGIVELLVDAGVVHDRVSKIKKGSTVELTLENDQVVNMKFLPPPLTGGS